jgi:hypothetical protein
MSSNYEYALQKGLAERADLAYPLNFIDRTKEEIKDLKEKLIRKERLLVLLESNPDIHEIFNLLK